MIQAVATFFPKFIYLACHGGYTDCIETLSLGQNMRYSHPFVDYIIDLGPDLLPLRVRANLVEASAPIKLVIDDGNGELRVEGTPFQTANARHNEYEMAHLIARYVLSEDSTVDKSDLENLEIVSVTAVEDEEEDGDE